MTVRSPGLAAALVAALPLCPAQDTKSIAYPERDILSPFRAPADLYAPPDELFHQLRIMQAIAARPDAKKEFDADGREIVDDDTWRAARAEVVKIGVDAAYLAQIMRLHKHGGERATAFYAMFFSDNRDDVFNLIAHIPGEPDRRTREAAMPRAVAFLRANLGRTFGSLSAEEKDAIKKAMPQIGSPAAKSAGLKRLPIDEDPLHEVRLKPFFQLLDCDEAIDQAQGLWFLKEVFAIRRDQALLWLEPALPRLRQLLQSTDANVREQTIGLLTVIGPKNLRKPPVDDPRDLQAWADEASKALFPPIRNINDSLIQLQPSPERDAIVAAGTKALESSAIGDPVSGQTADKQHYRGYRIVTVPDELKPLAIPREAIITRVNGALVADAASLLKTVREQLQSLKHPRTLLVEYVRDGVVHAIEYRIL